MTAKVLLIGAGAIGAFYGGVLAKAGCEVSAVARSDYDAVRSRGFIVESRFGDLSFRPKELIRTPGEYVGEAGFVVVALKLVPGIDRIELLRPVKGPIVLIQNGIGIEGEIAQAFPDRELLSAVAYAGVSREAPGHVRHHSQYTRLVLGRYPAGISSAAERFASLVKAGGGHCALTEDIVSERWLKCAWNSVFNPLSALGGGLGTRDILSGDEQLAFVRAAIEEVCAVAAADGHPLAADTAAKTIEGTLRMGNYVSSMGQDARAGRPMETEALVGNAVRAARRLGVAAPRLEALYAQLLMLEASRRPGSEALRPPAPGGAA